MQGEKLGDPAILSQPLYAGSVKDVYGAPGRDPYVFRFSDRYSIFDWGEMPDSLAGKGEALAVMGDVLFRQLGRAETWRDWALPERYPKFWRDSLSSSSLWSSFRREGLPHHSLGLVNERLEALPEGAPSRFLAVRALERPAAVMQAGPPIRWDYSAYRARPERSLVPLEVVFRFGAPAGSSFLSRLDSVPGYAQSFGFTEKPVAGEWFPYPVVEFFTKLEPTDRYLTRAEAAEVGGLDATELDRLVAFTLLLALRLKDIFGAQGLELWDGKFEFAFTPASPGHDGRGYQLVDSIGPDELRLIGPGGVHFSKEFLRRVYRGSRWYESAERAKKLAESRGQADWKRICRQELGAEPERLPAEALRAATELYPVLADALAIGSTGRAAFGGLPTVAELCARLAKAGL